MGFDRATVTVVVVAVAMADVAAAEVVTDTAMSLQQRQ